MSSIHFPYSLIRPSCNFYALEGLALLGASFYSALSLFVHDETNLCTLKEPNVKIYNIPTLTTMKGEVGHTGEENENLNCY